MPSEIDKIYDALSEALGANVNDSHQNGDDAVRTLAAERDAAIAKAEAADLERVRLRIFVIGACSTLDRASHFLQSAGNMRDIGRALIADTGDKSK